MGLKKAHRRGREHAEAAEGPRLEARDARVEVRDRGRAALLEPANTRAMISKGDRLVFGTLV